MKLSYTHSVFILCSSIFFILFFLNLNMTTIATDIRVTNLQLTQIGAFIHWCLASWLSQKATISNQENVRGSGPRAPVAVGGCPPLPPPRWSPCWPTWQSSTQNPDGAAEEDQCWNVGMRTHPNPHPNPNPIPTVSWSLYCGFQVGDGVSDSPTKL